MTGETEATGVQRLPEGWLVGRDCEIGGPPGYPVRVALVVLHPAFGIALLEGATWTEGTDDILRKRLAEAQFGAMFAGHLPILHGVVEPAEMPRLVPILADAFGGAPRLDLAGGDAWAAAVTRLVVPSDRHWADNLEGMPRATPTEPHARPAVARSGWRSRPADVVPLRRVAKGRTAGAEPGQTLPLPSPKARRGSWPWAASGGACVLVVALAISTPRQDPSPSAEPATIAAFTGAEGGGPKATGSVRFPSGLPPLPEAVVPAPQEAAPPSSPVPPSSAMLLSPTPLPVLPTAAALPPPRRAEPPAVPAARRAQRGETRVRAVAPKQKQTRH